MTKRKALAIEIKIQGAWNRGIETLFRMDMSDNDYFSALRGLSHVFNNEIQYTRECDYVRGNNG